MFQGGKCAKKRGDNGRSGVYYEVEIYPDDLTLVFEDRRAASGMRMVKRRTIECGKVRVCEAITCPSQSLYYYQIKVRKRARYTDKGVRIRNRR